MMDLRMEILNTSMKDKKNYFLMIQMDELQFPDKILKTTKYRTEIIPLSFYPDFQKNMFVFPNLSLGLIFRKQNPY